MLSICGIWSIWSYLTAFEAVGLSVRLFVWFKEYIDDNDDVLGEDEGR